MRSTPLNQGTVQSIEHLTQREEVIAHPKEVHDPEKNRTLLKQFLKGRRFKLDCGHCSTPCHNLANAMYVVTEDLAIVHTEAQRAQSESG